jgi:hypothetical protein
MRPTLPLALCSLLLAACSSGSRRSSDAGAAPAAAVLFDTSAGTDLVLDARADVLAGERADGTFTGNLLASGTVLGLARPSGSASGVRLPAVPPATYVALRLLLAEGGVTASGPDGRTEIVVPATRDVRVPFAAPAELGTGVGWVVVSHDGPPELARGADGRLTWQPRLVARLGDVQPLQDAVVSVGAVEGDAIAGTLLAGGLPVRMQPAADCEFSDDSGPRERADFLRDLRPSDEVECDGTLTDADRVAVRRCHARGRGANSSKLYGEVVALEPGVPAVAVQVREVVRGGAGIGTPLPVLRVRTQDARIRRSDARNERLGFDALAVGQWVEVEWHGPVRDGAVDARKIEIEDGFRGGIAHESQGRVEAVDLTAGTIRVVPRGDDPLVVGNRRVPFAVVEVGPGTVIVRGHGRDRRPATLADAGVGDRIWFWGRPIEPQRVQATAVRLRPER